MRTVVVVGVWILSAMLICDHYALIISGIIEMYRATTEFYNVFCTILFVVDPILIFFTTMSLLWLFYKQAS